MPSLSFDYYFTPSPNPIRASVGGANPSVVDLQVMISPGDDLVTVQSITVTIPVGDESPTSLSSAPSLPAPVFADAREWSVTVDGSDLVVAPADGASGKLLGAIVITLPGIAVNDAAGSVHVDIDEITSAGEATDESYRLVKHAADTPVSAFWAEPAVVYDLDQEVTLRWTCTDQGKEVVYAVSSGAWSSGDCLHGGACLTCADGVGGVRPPPPTATTTYTLDVVRTESGHRVISDTLTTTVQVQLPSVLPDVRREQLAVEHLVRLHWLALGAARCSLEVDGDTFADSVPLDTYAEGYLLHLPRGAGRYTLSVTAHAAAGSAAPFQEFQPLTLHSTGASFEVDPGGFGVALQSFSLDAAGRYALVPESGSASIYVLNLETLAAEGRRIATSPAPFSVALSPDARTGLVGEWGEGSVAWIDVGARALVGSPVKTAEMPFAMAITADGSTGVVVDNGGYVRVLDMARRVERGPALKVGGRPGAVAVGPDRSTALVANAGSGEIYFVHLTGTPSIAARIPFPGRPLSLALAADGKTAVVGTEDGRITLLDMATRTPGTSVPTPARPDYLALTPDASLALATTLQSGDLTVVELRTGRAGTVPLAPGRSLRNVLMHPDGRRAVTLSNAGSVYLV